MDPVKEAWRDVARECPKGLPAEDHRQGAVVHWSAPSGGAIDCALPEKLKGMVGRPWRLTLRTRRALELAHVFGPTSIPSTSSESRSPSKDHQDG